MLPWGQEETVPPIKVNGTCRKSTESFRRLSSISSLFSHDDKRPLSRMTYYCPTVRMQVAVKRILRKFPMSVGCVKHSRVRTGSF